MLRFKDVPEKAADTFYTARKSAARGAGSLYSAAMNHPKASSAVILGAGLAAALIWVARRNGGFRKLQQKTLARVRGRPARVKRERQAIFAE